MIFTKEEVELQHKVVEGLKASFIKQRDEINHVLEQVEQLKQRLAALHVDLMVEDKLLDKMAALKEKEDDTE